MEEHLTHIVKKRPVTRNAYRIVGLIFIVLGVWLIYMAFNGSGMRMLKAAFGICAILYGCTLFAGSFRPAAYTATYVFSDDGIHMIQKNRTRIISYDSITNINLVIPNPDMPYYIIRHVRIRYHKINICNTVIGYYPGPVLLYHVYTIIRKYIGGGICCRSEGPCK